MKNSPTNIGLLMVTIVAISVGLTYVTVTGVPEVTIDSVSSGTFMTGNVQVRLYDENHMIKAYRQTDNNIVVTGLEILVSQLFNDTRGAVTNGYANGDALVNFTDRLPTTGASSNTGGTLKFMGIGNGTAGLNFDDRQLDRQLDDSNQVGGPDCDRQVAITQNATDSSGNKKAGESVAASNLAQINITAIATFDGANCYSTLIREAGMWTDSNATGAAAEQPGMGDAGWMFARNTFGNVDLTENDSLELTWTFTFTDS